MSHFGLEGVLGSADGFIHVTEKLLNVSSIWDYILKIRAMNDKLAIELNSLCKVSLRILLLSVC
jgi:hypothetical protein